jgi:hypothetical protein
MYDRDLPLFPCNQTNLSQSKVGQSLVVFRVIFLGCKMMEGLTLIGVFQEESLSLARKGTL